MAHGPFGPLFHRFLICAWYDLCWQKQTRWMDREACEMAASWQERMQVGAAYDNGAWKWLRERGGSAWHRLVLCSRRMRRVAVGMLAVFLVCVGAFAWSWNTTPAVGSLDDQVQGEVAAHHAPYTAYNDISPLLVEALIA